MFINPLTAINEEWIVFPHWMDVKTRNKCIQPNAIDFTLDSLHRISHASTAIVGDNTKYHDLIPCPPDSDNLLVLHHNFAYDGGSDFYVNIPDGVACLLVIRSTFNRLGVHLNAGLYDSGFQGNIGFSLHNRAGLVKTPPHTRIGQIMFIESDNNGSYAGKYNTAQGQHWVDAITSNTN